MCHSQVQCRPQVHIRQVHLPGKVHPRCAIAAGWLGCMHGGRMLLPLTKFNGEVEHSLNLYWRSIRHCTCKAPQTMHPRKAGALAVCLASHQWRLFYHCRPMHTAAPHILQTVWRAVPERSWVKSATSVLPTSRDARRICAAARPSVSQVTVITGRLYTSMYKLLLVLQPATILTSMRSFHVCRV
jgi:hypothetical protein